MWNFFRLKTKLSFLKMPNQQLINSSQEFDTYNTGTKKVHVDTNLHLMTGVAGNCIF